MTDVARKEALSTVAECDERIADAQFVIDHPADYDVEARVQASRSQNFWKQKREYAVEIDRLRSLLLRAEQDRDEWKRKAEIDEQQAADRMDDWQVAHDHALKMQARALKAEEEREALREALEAVMPESHHPTCAVYLPQEECDCGYDLAEAALARIPESKES